MSLSDTPGDVLADLILAALFEGRIQTRSWQGQDGVKRYRTEIVADGLQLGPKASNPSTANYQSNNQTSRPSSYTSPSHKAPDEQSKSSVKEEDIPVINEDSPITSDPVISDSDVEETEINLKDIPF